MDNKRVTIYDLAESLGVSVATVNRALTGKGRISKETKRRVFEAVEKSGYKPNSHARSLNRKPIRLAALASTNFPDFHRTILEGIRAAQSELEDYNIDVTYYDVSDGAANTEKGKERLNQALQTIAENGFEGLMICAREVENFALLKEKGIRICTIVNDVDKSLRNFCVRYNGYTAGKMAEEILWWSTKGEKQVAISTASVGKHGIHKEILAGFREQMKITPVNVVEVCHNHDDPLQAYEQTKDLLRMHPDLGGIYVDSFNSLGVIHAVEESGKSIRLVTSDIYDQLRGYIERGFVNASIFQDPYAQGHEALVNLYHFIAEGEVIPDTLTMPPRIIMRSNLELFREGKEIYR